MPGRTAVALPVWIRRPVRAFIVMQKNKGGTIRERMVPPLRCLCSEEAGFQASVLIAVMRTAPFFARRNYFRGMFSRSVFHGSETSLLSVLKRMVMRRSRSKGVQPGLPVAANFTHALCMEFARESGGLVPSVLLMRGESLCRVLKTKGRSTLWAAPSLPFAASLFQPKE